MEIHVSGGKHDIFQMPVLTLDVSGMFAIANMCVLLIRTVL